MEKSKEVQVKEVKKSAPTKVVKVLTDKLKESSEVFISSFREEFVTVTPEAIKATEQEIKAIKIDSIDQVEDISRLKKVADLYSTLRNSIEKNRKTTNQVFNIIMDGKMAIEKEIKTAILPTETHIKTQLAKLKELEEVEAKRIADEQEALGKKRIEELIENGMSWNEGYYCIGGTYGTDEISELYQVITEMHESNYLLFLESVKQVNEVLQEKEKEEKEKQEKFLKDQQDLADNQKKLDEEKSALDLEKKTFLFEKAGYNIDGDWLVLENKGSKVSVSSLKNQTLDEVKSSLSILMKAIKDKENEDRLIAERFPVLEGFGFKRENDLFVKDGSKFQLNVRYVLDCKNEEFEKRIFNLKVELKEELQDQANEYIRLVNRRFKEIGFNAIDEGFELIFKDESINYSDSLKWIGKVSSSFDLGTFNMLHQKAFEKRKELQEAQRKAKLPSKEVILEIENVLKDIQTKAYLLSEKSEGCKMFIDAVFTASEDLKKSLY